jgi:hypothetical protein
MKPNHLSSAEDWYALRTRIYLTINRIEIKRNHMPRGSRERNSYTDACARLIRAGARAHANYLLCLRLNRREQ